MYLLQYLLKNK